MGFVQPRGELGWWTSLTKTQPLHCCWLSAEQFPGFSPLRGHRGEGRWLWAGRRGRDRSSQHNTDFHHAASTAIPTHCLPLSGVPLWLNIKLLSPS